MASVRGTDYLDFGYRNGGPVEEIFHTHSRYEIYYFHEGICNYLIGDRIYSLSPGDLILMNGMTLHRPKVDKRRPYIRTVIHFHPSAVKPFLELPQAVPILEPFRTLANFRLSLEGREREQVERLLHAMHERKHAGGPAANSRVLLAFADLLHVIYELCLQPLGSRQEFSSEKERTVQQIVTYVEERYMEDLDMDRLQDDLHVSKYYLSRLFKEVTGVTIFEFLYRRRINEAKILFLLDPALSVTEVCFRTGFKHLAHFSRLFKKQVGLTPEKYRRSMREQA
ncbi:helix-turn-helix transcriptional regulator [Cohnella caldifontis]|uniref:helix-turn-helix transcriptional regulator n=1 Tax=Cohnella caldifontis TaxID=3027471 RepID=UPI0023ED7AFA|nr:AraC family transcriptional regulator [Cohnella sp. YIM B05605]